MAYQLATLSSKQIQPTNLQQHLLAGEEVVVVQRSDTPLRYLTCWLCRWMITIGALTFAAFLECHEAWEWAMAALTLCLLLKLMHKSIKAGIPFDVITNKRILQFYESGERISSYSIESLKLIEIQNRIGGNGDLKLTVSLWP